MFTMVTAPRRPLFGTCSDNRTHLSEEGATVERLWHAISADYTQVAVSTLCVMPDHIHGHIHGILRAKEKLPFHIGVPIRAFKAQVTAALRRAHNAPSLQVWEKGYNDKIVWRDGSLAAYTAYIRDNPRRYCLKKAHPDLFRRVARLEHAALPPMNGRHSTPCAYGEPSIKRGLGTCESAVAPIHGRAWSGYGNLFLLDRPERMALRVSRSASASEIESVKADVLREAAEGTVVVSPFISPGEKEIALAILAASKGDVVLLKADGFPPFFKPHGKYFDLCCDGRLLILSPNLPEAKITRESCLFLNDCATRIAAINGSHSTPQRP